jgi:hypothetical protein
LYAGNAGSETDAQTSRSNKNAKTEEKKIREKETTPVLKDQKANSGSNNVSRKAVGKDKEDKIQVDINPAKVSDRFNAITKFAFATSCGY